MDSEYVNYIFNHSIYQIKKSLLSIHMACCLIRLLKDQIFKSLIKKILINIFKYFHNKNIFVAVTKQEYLSIRKKFKN